VAVAITTKIDQSIEELIGQLVHADANEALRIRARIAELEEMKDEYTTT
jgi:hypothetical protein